MFPTNVCFAKYNKKIGYRTPFMPVLAQITRVISKVHGTFCCGWKQRFLKKHFKKT